MINPLLNLCLHLYSSHIVVKCDVTAKNEHCYKYYIAEIDEFQVGNVIKRFAWKTSDQCVSEYSNDLIFLAKILAQF